MRVPYRLGVRQGSEQQWIIIQIMISEYEEHFMRCRDVSQGLFLLLSPFRLF